MKTIEKYVMPGFSTVFLSFLCFLAFSSCQRSQDLSSARVLRSAPSFELKDGAGKTHRLEDFRGGVTIVHFWATWCPPCIEEIPRWIAGAPSFKGLPVKLVAISVDETWEKARTVFPSEKLGSNMILLLDPTSEIAQKFGTKMFPETYVLDRDLKITDKWIGPQDWTGSMVRFGVAKALAQPGSGAR